MPEKRFVPRLPLSYVNRLDDSLHLQLQLRRSDALPDTARVRLVRGRTVVEGRGQVVEGPDNTLLSCDLPAAELGDGLWAVHVAPGESGSFEAVGAEVLLSSPNPVALLLRGGGAAKSTTPAKRPSHGGRASAVQRVARVSGAVLDRALAELPPRTARRVRAGVRRAARRVIR